MSTSSPFSAPSVVVAQDLRVSRHGRQMLRGVDLTVAPGETVAVLGRGDDADAPGVLLQLLSGLAVPDSGWVHWGRQDVVRLSDAARSALRRRDIGVVLDRGLLPELPVLENIALPLLLDGMSHRRAVGRAADLLDLIDLSGKGARRVSALSIRDRVLVAIGRALVTEPRLVVVHHPVEPSDPAASMDALTVLLAQGARMGSAVVVGTDDPEVAVRCARHHEIRDGRLHRGVEARHADQALL